MTLQSIDAFQLQDNVFTRIGHQWMLIAASHPDGRVSAMTASWGGLGFIWQVPVAFVFIRPQRFTKTFVEASTHFSLSFLSAEHRDALNFMGNVSGFADAEKVEHSGLELASSAGTPYFAASELVFICKRLYEQDMQKSGFFAGAGLERWYDREPGINDLHTLYIAEIEQTLALS